jgi:hypothetical protein
VVIDLKMVEFEPEFSGKMGFYIAAVDDLLRSEMDNPTIGIVLCKSKNKATVEYALRYIQHPVGVATYRLKDTKRTREHGSPVSLDRGGKATRHL